MSIHPPYMYCSKVPAVSVPAVARLIYRIKAVGCVGEDDFTSYEVTNENDSDREEQYSDICLPHGSGRMTLPSSPNLYTSLLVCCPSVRLVPDVLRRGAASPR